MNVLAIQAVFKSGLLLFLLARRIASRVVWTREARMSVLEVYAARDYPECHVPERLMPGLGYRRRWRAIQYCRRKGWLDWDMMVRLSAPGRERLARYRGETRARLPQARLVSPRSHS